MTLEPSNPAARTAAPRPVLICATQRSGSNLLASLLLQTWQVGWPGEWLVPPTELSQRQLYGISADAPVEQYLKVLSEKRGSPNGGFAIKLMWSNIAETCQRLAREDTALAHIDAHGREARFLSQLFPNALCVHIRRKDVVAQAVSLVKARQTGIWRQFETRAYDESKVSFQYEAILEAIAEIEAENAAWEAFFDRHNLEPVTLNYEELTDEPKEQVSRIVRAAGVDQPRLEKLQLNRGVKQQRDELSHRWKTSFLDRSERIDSADPAFCEQGPAPAGAFQILCEPESDYLELEPAAQACIRVRLVNEGSWSWKPAGDSSGQWLPFVHVQWTRMPDEPLREDRRGLLLKPLEPGATTEVCCQVTAPAEPGFFWLEFDFRQAGNRGASERGQAPVHLCVQVAPVDETPRASNHFGCLPPGTPNEAMRSDWLGSFNGRRFPWIHHRQHEWLFCSGSGMMHDDFWFHYPRLGLVWTSAAIYPRMFSESLSCWIRFLPEESDQHRRFVEEESGRRFELPVYGEPDPVAHPPAWNWIRPGAGAGPT